jgi:PRTRC genetic system protein E
MFRELMPILEGRTVMLTLSRIDDTAIRVCIIPKRVKEDSGENALCTPLTVIGTAEELDRDLAAQLSSYTISVVKLGSNLAEIEAAHSAAVKTVEEEKKKDLDKKRGKVSDSKTRSSVGEPKAGPAIKDGKPIFGTKDGQGATPLTLFDGVPQAVTAAEQRAVGAAHDECREREDEEPSAARVPIEGQDSDDLG